MASNENKKKALDAAIAKLEKDYGKGTVMTVSYTHLTLPTKA